LIIENCAASTAEGESFYYSPLTKKIRTGLQASADMVDVLFVHRDADNAIDGPVTQLASWTRFRDDTLTTVHTRLSQLSHPNCRTPPYATKRRPGRPGWP